MSSTTTTPAHLPPLGVHRVNGPGEDYSLSPSVCSS
jgi:hypothetical protein